MAKRQRPHEYHAPMPLTPSELRALYTFWSKGRKHWSYTDDPGEQRATARLVHLGYAERDTEYPRNVRITQEGIDRLQVPMRLYKVRG